MSWEINNIIINMKKRSRTENIKKKKKIKKKK